jgi:hypothetical protein
VVAIGEDAATASDRPINRTCETSADRHHAAPECLAVSSFDDEMRVIALQGVVHEAKPGAGAAFGEGALDLAHDLDGAE